MSDPAELIADAVVDYLNDSSRGFSMPFTAVNPEDPDRILSPVSVSAPKQLEVVVVPIGEERKKADRGAVRVEQTINVFVSRIREDGITKRLMNGFVNELIESLDFVGMNGYVWVETEVITKYDAERLRTDNRFLSVFSLRYYDVL